MKFVQQIQIKSYLTFQQILNNFVQYPYKILQNLTMEPGEQEFIPLSLDERTYRFFPTPKQQKTKFEKGGTRFFFYGQIQHDDYEKRKLKQLHEYAVKHKEEQFLTKFPEQKILLLLSGNAYKPQKCIAALKSHEDFLKKYIPAELTPQTEEILSGGLTYISGRDLNFRPIVVFNARKIDGKKIDAQLNALIYQQEQIIKNCVLPGQVQNWITIYDLGGLGLTEIPMGTLKQVLGTISQNYGGRLFKLFMLNAPSSVWFSWKIVSAFLDPVTVEKITISKESKDQKMFKYCKPSQVEKKYGGTQPDRTVFFPMSYPKQPNDFADESRLISQKEYEQMLKNGKLARNTINPKYAEKKQQ